LQRDHVERHDIAGADHTFSDTGDRLEVEQLTLRWLQRALAPTVQESEQPVGANA
jgi:hypothetical protein